MPTLINDTAYNRLRQKRLGGTVTGLWESTKMFHGSSSFPLPFYPYMTSAFTKFEKNYGNQPADTSYHLSGYGLTLNEALVSFLGESAERFAYASAAATLSQFAETSSHQDLAVSSDAEDVTVPPLDYINVFFGEDNDKHYVHPDDEIQWLKLPNLTQKGKKAYLPLHNFGVEPGLTAPPQRKTLHLWPGLDRNRLS